MPSDLVRDAGVSCRTLLISTSILESTKPINYRYMLLIVNMAFALIIVIVGTPEGMKIGRGARRDWLDGLSRRGGCAIARGTHVRAISEGCSGRHFSPCRWLVGRRKPSHTRG